MAEREDSLAAYERVRQGVVDETKANFQRIHDEMVDAPADSVPVPREEQRRRFLERRQNWLAAIGLGQPDAPGTLGEVVRREQQRYGLPPEAMPRTALNYLKDALADLERVVTEE